MNRLKKTVPLAVACIWLMLTSTVGGSDNPEQSSAGRKGQRNQDATAASKKATDKIVPLNKSGTVLLDVKGNRVSLKSKVVLREGLLEMLCCLVQTKEHESILAVNARAKVIHAGLLALGAKPGTTVRYFPQYKPATGQQIDI